MSDTQGTTSAPTRAMPTNADLLAELRAYNETVARDVAGLAAEVASLNRRIAALEMAAR